LQFVSLRLSGFKSFVDQTDVPIEPGLTGVVGPNGCGKSNLVEALKWVMGETSARQMRGDEMDDVIFKGTASRPTRNLAEVGLLLDNQAKRAPAIFNDSDQLEISRRIERGHGSIYRVNGKEVRARDVQTLFADAATGAHSAALVSQGRITQLVNAKPADRRLLLEEAAGISGLHSRRHEAELRLRAAEQNLARLEDVLIALDGQLHGLKRQARQATRYRNIGTQLRKVEAQLAHVRWLKVTLLRQAAEQALAESDRAVGALTGVAADAATRQAEIAAGLPPLRHAESDAIQHLDQARRAEAEVAAEEKRVAEARQEAENRRTEIATDIGRERSLADDARVNLSRLDEHRAALEAERAGEADARTEAEARLQDAAAVNEAGEAFVAERAQILANNEARQAQLERQGRDLEQRLNRIAQETAEVAAEKARLEEEAGSERQLTLALDTVQEAEARAEADRVAAERAEEQRQAASAEEARRREALQTIEATLARVSAEMSALSELLASGASGDLPPAVDALQVDSGFEAALGAALGDDLTAPIAAEGPVRWTDLPPLDGAPSLPAGVVPLAVHVRAPTALARRLGQIGVVADAAEAVRLLPQLKAGQRLVGRDGGLWRWDGFLVAPGAPTAAAVRLKQRNRHGELQGERARIDGERAVATGALGAARTAAEAAAHRDREAREAARQSFARVAEARRAEAALRQKLAAVTSRLSALEERSQRLAADRIESEAALENGQLELNHLGDLDAARQALAQRRVETAESRARLIELRGERDRLVAEIDARRRRLDQIGLERQSWEQRVTGAQARVASLEERQRAVDADIERLASRPVELKELRARAIDGIQAAEAARREAGDHVISAETALAEADRHLKQAERDLAEKREARVRAEGAVSQAEDAVQRLAQLIREKLECEPENVLEQAELGEGESPEAEEQLLHKEQRLVREREQIGPVNLRAEEEMRELDEQIAGLKNERGDLVQAIARLRHGIGELNREGRERLLASFDKVNAHFSDLFTRLFGGGRAFLKLTDSEDPLEAGLEIMASPPGTKLQVLSLMSGGETTLTALSLLFAVFLTNPAPICVLDEADAALDDANVDRFCTLLEDIAKETGTRFIIITHHRMTMSRMDRLYGVTMAERGISQLVAVDLREAERLTRA
jgi:chromosome segregation protein